MLRRVTDGRLFAAKLTNHPRDLKDAQKEAKSLSELNHENVVRYIDDFQHRIVVFNYHFLIMEHCEGRYSHY